MLPLYLMGKNHQNPGTYSVSFGYSNEKNGFFIKKSAKILVYNLSTQRMSYFQMSLPPFRRQSDFTDSEHFFCLFVGTSYNPGLLI